MIGTPEDIYLTYHDRVSAYVRGKVENYHDAEDLVSRIFEKVYRNLHTFDGSKASLSTWIYTISRNTVTDHFRTSRNAPEFADWMAYSAFPEEDPDEALENLADALLTLKEKERDLIILHYYKGLTLKDVAQRMGMSYVNAKVIHKKALTGLRLAMGVR